MSQILPFITNLIGNSGLSQNLGNLNASLTANPSAWGDEANADPLMAAFASLLGGTQQQSNDPYALFASLLGGAQQQQATDPLAAFASLLGGAQQQQNPLAALFGQQQQATDPLAAFASLLGGQGVNNQNYQNELKFAAENQRAMEKLQNFNQFKSTLNSSLFGNAGSSNLGNFGGYGQQPNQFGGFGMQQQPFGNSFGMPNLNQYGAYGMPPQGFSQNQMGYSMLPGYSSLMPQANYGMQQPMGYGMQQGYGMQHPMGYGMQQGYGNQTNDIIGNITGIPTSLLGIDQGSAQNALNFGLSLANSNSPFGLGNPTVRKLMGYG